MADYYPVLKRAIGALPNATGDSRRAVYERARTALLNQLSGYDPPLTPAEITDQRLSLEEAIRRVESETAGAAFGLPEGAPPVTPPAPPPVPPRAEPPRGEPPPTESKRTEPTFGAPRSEPPSADVRREPPPMTPPPAAPPRVPAGDRPPIGSRREPLFGQPQTPPPDPLPRPSPPSAATPPPSGADTLRSTRLAADQLGAAAARGVENARQAMASTSADRSAPAHEPDYAEPPAETDERDAAIVRQSAETPSRSPWRVLAVLLLLLIAGVGALAYSQRDRLNAFLGTDGTPVVDDVALNGGVTAEEDLEPKVEDRLPVEDPVAPDARTVTTERVTAEAETVAPAQPEAGAEATPEVATPAPTPEPPAAGEDAPVIVAQRAVLYEEALDGQNGARHEGTVVWSFVNQPVIPGEDPVQQIRAQISIPAAGLDLTMLIRPNNDAELPASHLVELNFQPGASFAGGDIDSTPGLILKSTEDDRGDPLVGAVAPIGDSNMFWVALSGTEADSVRNIGLLKEREWFDIFVRYGNRRRAILTFEKGTPGAQIFAEAFAAWGQ
jgi:hypothetical protein